MMSESAIQQRIKLSESQKGNRLWRNNNGACEDKNGRTIRYGLGNESAQIIKLFKSSDLIGITPHIITQEDIGRLVGIFTSIEVKKEGWVYTGTSREIAQLNWLNLITKLGGIARFDAGV